MGEHDPKASRKVAGAGGKSSGQQQQFQQPAGQMGGQAGTHQSFAARIREHMEVIGADGVHVGTVDTIEGDRIKLTKRDDGPGFGGGQHHGHHYFLPLGLVAGIEGRRVRLSANANVAYGMEEEE